MFRKLVTIVAMATGWIPVGGISAQGWSLNALNTPGRRFLTCTVMRPTPLDSTYKVYVLNDESEQFETRETQALFDSRDSAIELTIYATKLVGDSLRAEFYHVGFGPTNRGIHMTASVPQATLSQPTLDATALQAELQKKESISDVDYEKARALVAWILMHGCKSPKIEM